MANCPPRQILPFYRRQDQLRPGASARDHSARIVGIPYQPWGQPLRNIGQPPSFSHEPVQFPVNMELTDGASVEDGGSEEGVPGLELENLKADRFLLGGYGRG